MTVPATSNSLPIALVDELRVARRVTVLTGAGTSAEPAMPTNLSRYVKVRKTVQLTPEEQVFEPAWRELLPGDEVLLLIGGGEQNGFSTSL